MEQKNQLKDNNIHNHEETNTDCLSAARAGAEANQGL